MRDEPYSSPPAPSLPEPIVWTPPRLYFAPPKRSAWKEYGRPALLFGLTAISVYFHGGLELVVAVMAILLAHEMGHYLACRHYGVDATLPHFLPGPFISLIGTFGAFIRIRGQMPNRKALFDIGVAGPLAGFVVCLPVLYLGVLEIDVVESRPGALLLNEPLLIRLAMEWLVPPVQLGPNQVMAFGSFGLAAWFGLFLTALNLIPVGQLDGGHATYALLRGRAALISRIGSWISIGLIYFGPSWILWSVLLRVLGRQHPTTIDDEAPVGRGRAIVGVVCVIVFALCFVPNPIEWSWHDAWTDLREWWIST